MGAPDAFLAGTVLLAISGASQMFTITWSSTTPPPRARALTQRWLIIAGVAAVLVGVPFDVAAFLDSRADLILVLDPSRMGTRFLG